MLIDCMAFKKIMTIDDCVYDYDRYIYDRYIQKYTRTNTISTVNCWHVDTWEDAVRWDKNIAIEENEEKPKGGLLVKCFSCQHNLWNYVNITINNDCKNDGETMKIEEKKQWDSSQIFNHLTQLLKKKRARIYYARRMNELQRRQQKELKYHMQGASRVDATVSI